MTVRENLQMGAQIDEGAHFEEDLERVCTLFPVLKQRLDQRGGTLSGGEQQMLAIARALMSRPQLLLLDEPSLGLAPLVVKQIFEVIRELNKQGMTVFLVEQNAFHALKLAHRAYVMVNGTITMSGTGKELLARPEVRAAYLEGGPALSGACDVPDWLYDTGNGWVFLLVTVIIGGTAAFLSGRAIAQTWRPFWQSRSTCWRSPPRVRFFHYALFDEPMLSLQNYIVDFAVVLAAASLGYRIAPRPPDGAAVHWLFRRTGCCAGVRRPETATVTAHVSGARQRNSKAYCTASVASGKRCNTADAHCALRSCATAISRHRVFPAVVRSFS